MDNEIYEKLIKELEAQGYTGDIRKCGGIIVDEKGKRIRLPFPNEEYYDVLINYLGAFERQASNIHILNCLVKPKKYDLIPHILDQYFNTLQDSYRWHLGDALYTIGFNKNYGSEYINIIKNIKYGRARQMVVCLLGKSKQQEALPILLEIMHKWDYDVFPQVMCALSFFKDEDTFEEVFEFTKFLVSDEGKTKYFNELRDYNSELTKSDIKGCYKLLLKEINKTLKRHNCEITKEQMQFNL